jgi:hypothetical protein
VGFEEIKAERSSRAFLGDLVHKGRERVVCETAVMFPGEFWIQERLTYVSGWTGGSQRGDVKIKMAERRNGGRERRGGMRLPVRQEGWASHGGEENTIFWKWPRRTHRLTGEGNRTPRTPVFLGQRGHGCQQGAVGRMEVLENCQYHQCRGIKGYTPMKRPRGWCQARGGVSPCHLLCTHLIPCSSWALLPDPRMPPGGWGRESN